jgi:phage protein D
MVTIKLGYAKLGYAAQSEKKEFMTGRIKALSPGFASTGIPTLKIDGYDLSHDLQKTQGRPSYGKVMYSQIVTEIAKDNGLTSGNIEPTKRKYVKVERKKNEKDYAFIKRLAKEIGFEFFVRDNTLYFREPKDNKDGEITFEFRKNFLSFSPRMATANLVNKVRVTAWNEKEKKRISETATIKEIKSSVGIPEFDSIVEQSQGKKTTVKVEGRVVRSTDEAKALAIAELKRRNKGFIEGTLECIGDPRLRPGMTVEITKVGQRFSGTYYVTKAKHTIGTGGYRTSLTVRRCI